MCEWENARTAKYERMKIDSFVSIFIYGKL